MSTKLNSNRRSVVKASRSHNSLAHLDERVFPKQVRAPINIILVASGIWMIFILIATIGVTTFVRDVTIQTIGTLIAAVIAAIFGMLVLGTKTSRKIRGGWQRFVIFSARVWPTLILVAFNLSAGIGYSHITNPCYGSTPANTSIREVLVLLADFRQLNHAKYEPSEQWILRLPNQMKDAVLKEGLGFKELHQVVNSEEEARAIGKCYTAEIVVWGSIADGEIEVYYTPMRINSNIFGKTYLPSEDGTFEQFVRSGGDMEYVVNNLLARLYNPQDPKHILFLTNAINQTPSGREKEMNVADLYALRGFSYELLGETVKALTDYNKAIALNSEDARPLLYRGNFYQNLSQSRKAIADYEQAIKLNQNFAAPHHNLGYLYSKQGELALALDEYNKAIAIDSNQSVFYNNRAEVLNKLHRPMESLADLNRAIELNPLNIAALINRGGVNYDLGNLPDAIRDFEQALTLSIDYEPDVSNEISSILQRLRN